MIFTKFCLLLFLHQVSLLDNPLQTKKKKIKTNQQNRTHAFKKFIYFWPHCTACGILVPSPGMEPMPPAVEARSLNHWTAREVPHTFSSYFLGTHYIKILGYRFVLST